MAPLLTEAHDRAVERAVQAGCVPTFAEAETRLRQAGSWDDARQAKCDELWRGIQEGLAKLARGDLTLAERRKVALDVRAIRAERDLLKAELDSAHEETAEGAGLRALVEEVIVRCSIFRKTRRAVFTGVTDFRERPLSFRQKLVSAVADALSGYYGGRPEEIVLSQHEGSLAPSC